MISLCFHFDDNLNSQCKHSSCQDIPGGPGMKNLPPNARDLGAIRGQRTKIPHAMGQLNLALQWEKPLGCNQRKAMCAIKTQHSQKIKNNNKQKLSSCHLEEYEVPRGMCLCLQSAPSQELKMLPYIMQEFCGNLNRDKSWENWVILWHMTADKLNIQALCDVSAQCHIYVVNK